MSHAGFAARADCDTNSGRGSCEPLKCNASRCFMIAYLSERENVVEQVNSLCLQLFDTWCESRSVTALAYLMHCWPLIESTPAALRRLGETMCDLRRYHPDQLDAHG